MGSIIGLAAFWLLGLIDKFYQQSKHGKASREADEANALFCMLSLMCPIAALIYCLKTFVF